MSKRPCRVAYISGVRSFWWQHQDRKLKTPSGFRTLHCGFPDGGYRESCGSAARTTRSRTPGVAPFVSKNAATS